MRKEPWFEKCESCDCITFNVKVTPFGKYGTDHLFICTKCGEGISGVINDPFEEWVEETAKSKEQRTPK